MKKKNVVLIVAFIVVMAVLALVSPFGITKLSLIFSCYDKYLDYSAFMSGKTLLSFLIAEVICGVLFYAFSHFMVNIGRKYDLIEE